MKKAALIALLVLAVALPSFGQTVDWSKKTLQSERSRSYDARHYLVKIELDLDRKAFEGSDHGHDGLSPGGLDGLRPGRRGVHGDVRRQRRRRRP